AVSVSATEANHPRSRPATRAWIRWLAPLAVVFLVLFRRPQRDVFYASRATSPDAPASVASRTIFDELVLRLAAQDWLLLTYLSALLFETLLGHGPQRTLAIGAVALDLGIFTGVLWLVRGGVLAEGPFRRLVYSVGVLVAILGSFFELQWILPVASGP